MKRFRWIRDGRGIFLAIAALVGLKVGRLISTIPIPWANALGWLVTLSIVALVAYMLSKVQWRERTEEEEKELRAARQGRGRGLVVALGLYGLGIALIVGVALLARATGKDVDLFADEPTAPARYP